MSFDTTFKMGINEMSLVTSSHRLPKWVLVIDLLCGHDLDSLLNYSFKGATFALVRGSNVRAGSVIFLVGVGSLVCWKIWDYWNSGDASCGDFHSSPPPKTPSGGKKTTKTPSKSSKAFFASFLEEEFVHDFEEFEDEDPALIQGKYFGPESPVENNPYPKVPDGKIPEFPCLDDNSPLTSEYSGRPDVTRKDLADTSGAYQADDDEGSSFSSECEESLPFDGAPESTARETKRLKKRRHGRRLERSHCLDISSNRLQKNGIQKDSFDSPYRSLNPKHLTSNRSLNSLETDISSSETSPRDRIQESAKATTRQSRACSFRRQDGERVAKGEETSKQQKSFRSVSASGKPYFYANWNSDEEWDTNDGETPNREGLPTINPKRRSLSREISLSDLMGRLRKKASLRSLSRDNSLSSRMSDILRREDSISSNLSDFACSECSEISLDLSLKDDTFADLTITSLADIEDELNTLKSSVIEMDEEVLKFSSIPNPYLLKTTFSDYSLDSDSRPESALDFMSYRKSRSRSGSVVDSSEVSTTFFSETIKSSINDPLDEENSPRKSTFQSSKGNSSHSSDKEKSSAEWTPSKIIRITRRRSSTEGVIKLASQDDALPSLEWDNGCFKQYEDDLKPTEEKSEYEMGQSLDRHKFLPDHSSLELDLEKELLSSVDCNPTFSGRDILAGTLSPCVSPLDSLPSHAAKKPSEHIGVASEKHRSLPQRRQPPTSLPLKSTTEIGNQMTASVDSAIQSAPGSRSGSSSPVSHMTQSMMRYGPCFGVNASIKGVSGGGCLNSLSTEEHLTRLLEQLNHLIYHSNVDSCVRANTQVCNKVNPHLNIQQEEKSTKYEIQNFKSKDNKFDECLSRSDDCSPCPHCRKMLFKLNVLKKQNMFLFAQTPAAETETRVQNLNIPNQNISLRLSTSNIDNEPNEKNKRYSAYRDSAIDLEIPTSINNSETDDF